MEIFMGDLIKEKKEKKKTWEKRLGNTVRHQRPNRCEFS